MMADRAVRCSTIAIHKISAVPKSLAKIIAIEIFCPKYAPLGILLLGNPILTNQEWKANTYSAPYRFGGRASWYQSRIV